MGVPNSVIHAVNKGRWEGEFTKDLFRRPIAALDCRAGGYACLFTPKIPLSLKRMYFDGQKAPKLSETALLRILSRLIQWDASRSEFPTKINILFLSHFCFIYMCMQIYSMFSFVVQSKKRFPGLLPSPGPYSPTRGYACLFTP